MHSDFLLIGFVKGNPGFKKKIFNVNMKPIFMKVKMQNMQLSKPHPVLKRPNLNTKKPVN